MTSSHPASTGQLKQSIKDVASRLGFTLAGFAAPELPAHTSVFERWLAQGRHATRSYMASDRSRAARANPRLILPGCKIILVLAAPYSNPTAVGQGLPDDSDGVRGRIAAYAWGEDYHEVLPKRLQQIIEHIQHMVGHEVPNRCYTDTGPILERDLAQRAGLGWIGKNTCLINPRRGSYFLLAEILLDLELEPDPPFTADHCGSCTRCIDACPTHCILPDRTIDSGRCISYLTIELRDEIPPALRPSLGNWIFGCDVCQMVCPWNRFALPEGDPGLRARKGTPLPVLEQEMSLSETDFSQKFVGSPIKRARRRGYLRNVAVALGNAGRTTALRVLQQAETDRDELVRRHASWAVQRLAHGRTEDA